MGSPGIGKGPKAQSKRRGTEQGRCWSDFLGKEEKNEIIAPLGCDEAYNPILCLTSRSCREQQRCRMLEGLHGVARGCMGSPDWKGAKSSKQNEG